MLEDDADLGPEVVKTLRELRDRGVLVVAATGRRYDSAAPILRRAGLRGWVVVQNGAVVRDLEDGRRGRTAYVEAGLGRRLCEAIEQAGLDPVVYTDSAEGPGEFWVPDPPRDPTGFLGRYLPSREGHFSRCSKLSERSFERITRVICHGPLEALRGLDGRLREVGGLRTFQGHDITQGVHRLEALNEEADKWRGVCWVARQAGVSLEDSVAVGDDANDVEMLRRAATSYAPSRSHPAALQAAGVVLDGEHRPERVVAELRRHYGLSS